MNKFTGIFVYIYFLLFELWSHIKYVYYVDYVDSNKVKKWITSFVFWVPQLLKLQTLDLSQKKGNSQTIQ